MAIPSIPREPLKVIGSVPLKVKSSIGVLIVPLTSGISPKGMIPSDRNPSKNLRTPSMAL